MARPSVTFWSTCSGTTSAAKELVHIVNWMQKNSTQQAKLIKKEMKEKT
jgi:hypothetical protein